jgi:hypothetical protein
VSLSAIVSTGWGKVAAATLLLSLPLLGSHLASNVRVSVSFQGEVPGLRYRNDPGSLFIRSSTNFETQLGQSTPAALAGTVEYLEERFGIETTCPVVPVIDVFRSDFLTGNIVMADGAWAFYTADDLAGGPCPTTNLDPRQPSFYLETILQRGSYTVDLSVGPLHLPISPSAKIVQVLVLPAKPGLVVGGTYAAEHGAYTLVPISPADLTVPFDDMIFGTMRLEWGGFREDIALESLEPNTTSPAGHKSQTLLLDSPRFGTGVYVADYSAMAPYLTPRRVNFRYQGSALFPFNPATDVHAHCVSDFSDPANLKICPDSAP